jgi:hypothetical protein
MDALFAVLGWDRVGIAFELIECRLVRFALFERL